MSLLLRRVYPLVALVVLGTFGMAKAVAQPATDSKTPDGVLTGLDVLVRDNFAPLAGRKIGLITNHTGLTRDGRTAVELLHKAPNVELKVLFSPEHGLYGKLDEKVGHGTDPQTGLKVYSLYGETQRPTPEMLAGLDALVFDIQDIGARFYTYIATLGYAMEEAAKAKIEVFVLDRPNPITGTRVFGPLPDRDGGFTFYHQIPLVHGMTVGELASMFKVERRIDVKLSVIAMEGWRRDTWYDATGLPWINPSPNMRSLTEATLYPAIGLIEACKVSVGRGTDTPFERFGAPWIDARRLAAQLNGLHLAGVSFVPFSFTPTSSKFKDQVCHGVQILLLDRNAFDPLEIGMAIVRVLHAQYPKDFDVDKVNNLLVGKAVLDAVLKLDPAAPATPVWAKELDAFKVRRQAFLLYP